MTDAEAKLALDDWQALSITIDAEGRGDWREGHSSVEERIAVASVIRNRVHDRSRRWSNSYVGVCLKRGQFSCWFTVGGVSNYTRTIALARFFVDREAFPVMSAFEQDLFHESEYLAAGVLRGVVLDRVNGANHYYAPAAMRPAGSVPVWADGKTPIAKVGSQLFFRL